MRTFSEVNLWCKFQRVSDTKHLCILILFLVIVFFFPVVILLTSSLQKNYLHARTTGLTFTGCMLWLPVVGPYIDLTLWSLCGLWNLHFLTTLPENHMWAACLALSFFYLFVPFFEVSKRFSTVLQRCAMVSIFIAWISVSKSDKFCL